MEHLFPQLKPLLKEEELTRQELGLNFPQANLLEEGKILKVTGYAETGSRGRPPKLYALTKKGERKVAAAKNGSGPKKSKAGRPKGSGKKVGRPKGKTTAKKATSKKVGRPQRKVKASGGKAKIRIKA